MEHASRRHFLQDVAVGSLAACVARSFQNQLQAQNSSAIRYDLLIKGGRVIDPSQKLAAVLDVAIAGGKIVRVAEKIDKAEARRELDAAGKIITPGLIDVHVHVYDGVGVYGIPADPNCIARGVTTVLDAGSAGAHTFAAFRKHVIQVADTRVYALLNLSVVGLTTSSLDNPYGELLELRYVNPKLAIRTIEQNRDAILGIKIRLSEENTGDRDLKILALAKEAADAVKLPLMVHIGKSHSPLRDILAMLRKGDVVTHCFHGKTNGVLDDKGKVVPEIKTAVARGVYLDVGHGVSSFSFDVAEKALKQELLPDIISTDVHHYNVHGPVFDLATTLSKFLHLGLTLEQVIERATIKPASVFNFPKGLGTLREGADGDIAVFSLTDGDFTFVDSQGQKRRGRQKLVPVATVKAGKLYGSASIPAPEGKD
jgi:dihydroorotase